MPRTGPSPLTSHPPCFSRTTGGEDEFLPGRQDFQYASEIRREMGKILLTNVKKKMTEHSDIERGQAYGPRQWMQADFVWDQDGTKESGPARRIINLSGSIRIW